MMAIDSKTLHSKLKEFFGFDSFKGDQERIITHLVAGNDAFVCRILSAMLLITLGLLSHIPVCRQL